MINGKLQEFVCNLIAKDRISYGDVRRLQRDYLPGGIMHREELELLICLNAGLVRADKTWAQWLAASVAEFVARREGGEHPIEEAFGEWIGRLLAASTTRLGRRIARQVQRELGRHDIQLTTSQLTTSQLASSDQPQQSRDISQPSQAMASEDEADGCSLQMAKPPHRDRDESLARSRPPCRTTKPKAIPDSVAVAAHGWCLAGYLPAVQRSHLINFQGSSAALVLAPCR
jgi:hypothetical protein